ncbi:Pol polyprotein [Plakobranchus ocellatus]|uniref:Pol polyprotein n=1 Tax=Plakobranchus ocellatus TaxID=259542 RepID=A0AAV3ZY19_9GAST|nr:Pol polyprotein [Plakobranchus ocellatus]
MPWESYYIILKGEGISHCIYKTLQVVHPLLPKVKVELDRIVNKGVVSETSKEFCHVDDIIIDAKNENTHERVRKVKHTLQKAGLTLNEKCAFSKRFLKYLGHIIDGSGIRTDPSTVKAIIDFPQPQNVIGLQRFLGIVNQMTKFSSKLADATEPLRHLLKKDSAWP